MNTECYYGFWTCGCPVLGKTLCLSITDIMYVNPFTEQPVHALVLYIYLYYVLQSTMHLYIRLHGLYVANVQFMWIMLKWTNIIPSH